MICPFTAPVIHFTSPGIILSQGFAITVYISVEILEKFYRAVMLKPGFLIEVDPDFIALKNP